MTKQEHLAVVEQIRNREISFQKLVCLAPSLDVGVYLSEKLPTFTLRRERESVSLDEFADLYQLYFVEGAL